jgi:alpha-L-rhamnosidase
MSIAGISSHNLMAVLLFGCASALAQRQSINDIVAPTLVDPFPVRAVGDVSVQRPVPSAPERYIWISNDEKADVVGFRAHFEVKSRAAVATLYVAGPRAATIYLNGIEIANFAQDINAGIKPSVYTVSVGGLLRKGRNLLAIEARPIQNPWYMPKEYMLLRGRYLVAKIVPAREGLDRKPLAVSDGSWRSFANPTAGWARAAFDDSNWSRVQSLGPMDGNIDNYQWNGDGGLYRWPGYVGIAPYLRHLTIPIATLLNPVEGIAHFQHLEALTQTSDSNLRQPFVVNIESPVSDEAQAPSMVLDFGREIVGRVRIGSLSTEPVRISLQYGESFEEAVKKPYLGQVALTVVPNVTAYGPKTAFRFVKIRFLSGPKRLVFPTMDADAIYYPVEYTGSFESSDPMLNRIWLVGAYTAHLCMQDSIWDGPKRDRGRWMGDLSVSGRVIETAFNDRFLLEDTLRRLNHYAPNEQKDVNGIPGYSALWVIGLADYYRHTGTSSFLIAIAPHLQSLLAHMRHDLDENHLYSTAGGSHPFIDWSRDLVGPTSEAVRATNLEYYRAFTDGAYLLQEAGLEDEARQSEKAASLLRKAAFKNLLDSATDTYGDRWQTNAMAVYSGLADSRQTEAIRNKTFSQVDRLELPKDDVSPYYGSYIIDAMAKANDRAGALGLIRLWWGGMLKEGATSFWEGYDPRWPRDDFHAHLHADGAEGYFVSLAHGWSAGPTAWLTEQVLGIQPTAPGFKKISVRPDLMGLSYARGSEATPRGLIRVDARVDHGLTVMLDLPPGCEVTVSMPVTNSRSDVTVGGMAYPSLPTEEKTRRAVQITGGGHYVLHSD